MPYLDHNPIDAIWNDRDSPQGSTAGLYIAVSGNTGAGKSTLVNALARKLRVKGGANVIAVNERALHHPLLKLMFAEPDGYAFWIQMNFLLQRHLCLKRLLSLGKTVVIERSHLDDTLFLEHLHEKGYITERERALYASLSALARESIREPDLWLCLKVDAQTSYERVTRAEVSGERPVEFPDDGVKMEFIRSWSKRYAEFFASLESKPHVIFMDGDDQPTDIAHKLWPRIQALQRSS